MALAAATILEVQTTGDDDHGGGFVDSSPTNVAYSYVRRKFGYEETGKLFVNMIRELYG